MKKIGKYEIIELLGQGGMGKVYKARMLEINSVVALKILSPHEDILKLVDMNELKKRFIKEATIISKISHTNIVGIRDFDEFDGPPFFTMDYYPNTLAILLGDAKPVSDDRTRKMKGKMKELPKPKVITFTRQIMKGLNALHQANIVHRDIKPQNILVAENDKIKLCDFGISKVLGEEMTTTGKGFGSPFYIAPEQSADASTVDGRADIYSLGILLYHMVTGALPRGRFRRPSQIVTGYSADWDDFIFRAMNEEPNDRFKDMSEMEIAFESLISKRSSVRKPISSGPVIRKLRSKPKRWRKLRTSRAKKGLYVASDFLDNNDGTLTDRATGLMWEKKGSESALSWDEAKDYIAELNRVRSFGYDDWRLPTLEELKSILAKQKTKGHDLYIDSMFDLKAGPDIVWSADKGGYRLRWSVNFGKLEVSTTKTDNRHYLRAVRAIVLHPTFLARLVNRIPKGSYIIAVILSILVPGLGSIYALGWRKRGWHFLAFILCIFPVLLNVTLWKYVVILSLFFAIKDISRIRSQKLQTEVQKYLSLKKESRKVKRRFPFP